MSAAVKGSGVAADGRPLPAFQVDVGGDKGAGIGGAAVDQLCEPEQVAAVGDLIHALHQFGGLIAAADGAEAVFIEGVGRCCVIGCLIMVANLIHRVAVAAIIDAVVDQGAGEYGVSIGADGLPPDVGVCGGAAVQLIGHLTAGKLLCGPPAVLSLRVGEVVAICDGGYTAIIIRHDRGAAGVVAVCNGTIIVFVHNTGGVGTGNAAQVAAAADGPSGVIDDSACTAVVRIGGKSAKIQAVFNGAGSVVAYDTAQSGHTRGIEVGTAGAACDRTGTILGHNAAGIILTADGHIRVAVSDRADLELGSDAACQVGVSCDADAAGDADVFNGGAADRTKEACILLIPADVQVGNGVALPVEMTAVTGGDGLPVADFLAAGGAQVNVCGQHGVDGGIAAVYLLGEPPQFRGGVNLIVTITVTVLCGGAAVTADGTQTVFAVAVGRHRGVRLLVVVENPGGSAVTDKGLTVIHQLAGEGRIAIRADGLPPDVGVCGDTAVELVGHLTAGKLVSSAPAILGFRVGEVVAVGYYPAHVFTIQRHNRSDIIRG